MAQAGTAAGTTGRIVSYTVIYVPTPEFAHQAPYALAIIETPDGNRLLARIADAVDSDGLRIGAAVAHDHDDERGPVFRLA